MRFTETCHRAAMTPHANDTSFPDTRAFTEAKSRVGKSLLSPARIIESLRRRARTLFHGDCTIAEGEARPPVLCIMAPRESRVPVGKRGTRKRRKALSRGRIAVDRNALVIGARSLDLSCSRGSIRADRTGTPFVPRQKHYGR